MIFAAIHFATAIMIASKRFRVYGAWLSVLILSYYWAFVKPREPIAEPQSVGILAISTILLEPHLKQLFKGRLSSNWPLLAARLGVAYPFFEWGLDALRNPHHFRTYLTANPITQPLMQTMGPGNLILALGVFEVSLALLLAFGLLVRIDAIVVLAALVVFGIVARYPLALPQDIALAAAAIFLRMEGSGPYSLDRVFKRFFSSSL
jgi:uncharacterized membrane protein YphA (DoxX/SURF4 family)